MSLISKSHAATMLRSSLALVSCLGLSSCDKVKEISTQVKDKVGDTLEDRLQDPAEVVVENPLMRLVDQTEEGVVFRKDLDFPTELKVTTVHKQKIAGRIFRESELGRDVESVNGKETVTVVFERKGSTVTYNIEGSSFELPVKKAAEGEEQAPPKQIQNPFRQAPPPTKPMTYVLQSNGGWKGKSGGDFKLMAMNQQLSPVFADLLTEHSVLSRPLWYSSSRVKIGDEFELSGASLSMVITGKAKGKVILRLEKIEEVNNHPCGLFSITGEYRRTGFPNPEGRLLDQEVSIESGELWLSLLYPIILKEKLKTIQTFSPSEGGGSVGRAQGTVDTLVVREWGAKIPIPDPPAESEPEVDDSTTAEGASGEEAPAGN